MPREFGVCRATTPSPRPAAFSKSVKNFAKNTKKSLLGHTFWGKMLSPKGATKFFFSETNFICMNFIRLQWLAAGIVPGENNGLLSWSMEFGVRPKTEFSYDFFESCQLTIWKSAGIVRFPANLMFFRPFWFYRCWAPLWIQIFFKKVLARARARNYEPSKNEHLFRVLQKVAATKKLFCRNVENGKKKYLDWQKFL